MHIAEHACLNSRFRNYPNVVRIEEPRTKAKSEQEGVALCVLLDGLPKWGRIVTGDFENFGIIKVFKYSCSF